MHRHWPVRWAVAIGLATGAFANAPAIGAQAPQQTELPNLRDQLRPADEGLTATSAAARAALVIPAVLSAKAREDRADAAAKRVRSDFLPDTTLRASYLRLSRISQPPIELDGVLFDNPFPVVLDNFALRARISLQATDYFLTILPNYRSAQRSAIAAEHETDVERQGAAFRAQQSFYDYVRTGAALLVAKDSVRSLQSNADTVEALVHGGELPRSDFELAQAQLADARVARLDTEGQLSIAAVRLRRAIHMPADEPLAIAEDVFSPLSPDVPSTEELLELAFAQRPEVNALREAIEAQGYRVRMARGNQSPKLIATAGADYVNPNERILPLSPVFKSSWDVGVALAWSPDGFAASRRQMKEERFGVEQVRQDLEGLRDRITVEVTEARATFLAAHASIEAAGEGVQAARASYTDRAALLSAGEATTNELLLAESRLRQSQLTAIDAYINARLAYAAVQFVIGRSVPSMVSAEAGNPP